MLQGCFVIWNQQPTCHLQDFHNSATLSSRLGMIFLLFDNAIFVLIITMMWEIFYARGFWEVQYASLLPWTSQSDCLDLMPFQLREVSNNQNKDLRWIFPLSVGLPPPPLNGHNFQTFFTPLFSFAIDSYMDETDFALGLSQKYHLSKLTFISSSGRWVLTI